MLSYLLLKKLKNDKIAMNINGVCWYYLKDSPLSILENIEVFLCIILAINIANKQTILWRIFVKNEGQAERFSNGKVHSLRYS